MTPLDSYRDLFEHVFEQSVGQDFPGWIADQLDAEPDVSWRELERRIEDKTGGLLTLSHVTLSSWFTEYRNNLKAAA